MTGASLRVETDGGSFETYVARPPGGEGPAIVLLQEIFGVNEFVRRTADRFAEEGYVVLAPDLFWRLEPGVELTDKGADLDRALDLAGRFDVDGGLADIGAVIEHLGALPGWTGGVALVGYCMGGLLAALGTTSLAVDVAVGYYPVGLDEHLDKVATTEAPLVLHLAGDDPYCPPAAQQQIRDALLTGPDREVYVYLGASHPFANPLRAGFHRSAAGLAYSRTLSVLRRAVGPVFNLSDLWDQHLACEFMARDTQATMDTMVEDPYVHNVPTSTGGAGYDTLARFYKHHFIDTSPADQEIIPISRTVSADRLVDESVVRFTHDRDIPWLLPGVPPTGRKVELAMVAIVTFRGGKLCNEHIYWDHAALLQQVGLLDGLDLPIGGRLSTRTLVEDTAPTNELMPDWETSAGKPAP